MTIVIFSLMLALVLYNIKNQNESNSHVSGWNLFITKPKCSKLSPCQLKCEFLEGNQALTRAINDELEDNSFQVNFT